MSVRKAFLPVGLILACLAALAVPAGGVALKNAHMISGFVIIIFLVNGWEFKVAETRLDRRFLFAFASSAGLSLILGPFIGLWVAHLFGTDPLMTTGLVVMAAVPVTLSSATVMAEISDGNRAWALLMTIGLNLLGIFTLPLMLKLTLESGGNVEISAGVLLAKLIQLVLLPFLAGFVLKRFLGARVGRVPLLAYIPSTCVILTVYAGFAASRDMFISLPLGIYLPVGGAAFIIHLALMALALTAARLLTLGRRERNAYLFVTSQKTLPVAISVISIIATDNALALVPCLLFHFIQLFFDSFVASHLAPSER